MRYLSVCSGIEAATVAWRPLGWTSAAFSEIEAFPRAVLAYHYPTVPLHGDFTTIKGHEYGAVDLLVGGTPCQSFSVAGLRKGLDDPRGNLMLEYGALAKRLSAKWLVWENVPGVLSSNSGRDFGAFLGMLVELGYGFAYRVLDAQHFGVPQRRRRVFVVACLGDWRVPAAVLFERHSMQGNPAPSRQAGQNVAGTIARSVALRGREGGTTAELGDDLAGCLRASGGGGDKAHALAPIGMIEGGRLARCLTAKTRIDAETETLIPTIGGVFSYAIQAGALRTNPNSGPDGVGVQAHIAYTLEARAEVQAVCVTGDITHTLKAEGFDASEDGTGRGQPIVVVTPIDMRQASRGATMTNNRKDGSSGGAPGAGIGQAGDPAPTISTSHVAAVHAGMAVRRLTPRECERLQGFPDNYTLVPHRGKPAADGPRYKALGNSMAVPCMAWIGSRIQAVIDIQSELEAA